MGALAYVSSWIPEDDLLLKNAVEAGASLESLAKGAVQFSQRFTVQELQDRWRSLLYDPVVSAEACARMIEFEHSASTLPSKSYRFKNTIGNRFVSGKRKAESVRKCYYAMRKRICNEPFDTMDLSMLVSPGNKNVAVNGDEPPSADCLLGEQIHNHFGLQDSNFDVMDHDFPDLGTGGGAATSVDVTAHAFCMGLYNCAEEDLPVDQNNIQKKTFHTFEENLSFEGNCSVVEELEQPRELSVCNLFETDDLEADAKPLAYFYQVNGNEANVCSGFGGGQVLNSPVSDRGTSFHDFGYSSPLPQMPIWSTIEDISAPTLPGIDLEKEKRHTENTFALPVDVDGNNTNNLGYDVVHSDTNLENQMSFDNAKSSSPSTYDYLAELSNSLFNFTNEEELLFMDADGKDTIDRSYIDGLSSLLLDSPNEDDMLNVSLSNASLPPDECARPGELGDKGQYHCGDGHRVCGSEAQMLPSASTVNPEFPELHNGVICCMLNVEDPEIPCNDEAFPASQMPSSSLSLVTQRKYHESNHPTSSTLKDFSGSRKTNDGGPNLMKSERNNFEQSHLSSKIMGSRLLSEMGLELPIGNLGIKLELPCSDFQHVVSRNSSTACRGPSQNNTANVSGNNLLPATEKGVDTKAEQAKHLSYNTADCYIEKQAHGYDSLVTCPQKNASGSKQEVDAVAAIHKHEALHAELGSIEMTVSEQVVKPSPSYQEEFPSESDDDVPYFSDVEAMILDMDLSPDDLDLYSSRDVSIYQHEDSKRAIIRLEQAADAYIQRSIASQGAFAVLYGRHSKHYIKKPEVLLGRAAGVNVDIDLGREGHGKKISRRQALIKMDEDGSFHLKNLGRGSIFVNSKEVTPKQSLTLTSSCLIEVREIPFVFETNQTRVQQYVDNKAKGGQAKEHKD